MRTTQKSHANLLRNNYLNKLAVFINLHMKNMLTSCV